ncbi:MAG: NAD-dependent epimerase/dehydratase family protein [Bacteroidales bacterium]|nr:NAD-dependent epimerase/dehydratase family protein [Bacteroidales bacterium]MDZ4203294.1 NAD-dependent epimerase/dehydratase family protein [Bacteroidales bacterium]
MNKRKVLLLGGGGFIGFAIVRILAGRGNYDITIADNFIRNQDDEETMSFIAGNNIRLIREDFTDPKQFNKLEEGYDDFYMLASMIGVNNTLEMPHEIIRVNTALIYNSLEWLKRAKVKNVLFTSTSECYSATTDVFGYRIPTPEEVPLCVSPIGHPRFTYAVTKMLGESGFLTYGKVLGFNCKIIRYSNIFGPRMGFKHVIPHLVERFLDNENPYHIYGGEQTRSFCYIDDGALGTILAMENQDATGDIFHIGAKEEITIEELVRETGKYFDYTGQYISAPTYPGSVARRCPDISKAERMLGFSPKVDWRIGLVRTIEWYIDYFQTKSQDGMKYFEGPDKFYKA